MSYLSEIEAARWDFVRRWITNQEPLYIPGIHQARTIEAVNEAVDRAIVKDRLNRVDRTGAKP